MVSPHTDTIDEHTDNPHERDAYMERAQQLATLNAIDLAKARTLTAARNPVATPVQRTITIGKSRQRGLRTYVDLFLGIAAANDVRVDIETTATKVYAYGYPEDIDITETLYVSLLTQMVTACTAFLATGEYKNETVRRKVRAFDEVLGYYCYEWRRVPVTKVTARLEFQSAFASQVARRLHAARRTAEAEAVNNDDTATTGQPGTAIVLAEKRATVDSYYKGSSTARGSYRGHQSTVNSRLGRDAGDRAGRAARLSAASSIGGRAADIERAAS